MTRQLTRYRPRSRLNLGQVARSTAGALVASRGNPYALAARGAGYLARYAGNQMYKAITYKGYKGRSAGTPAKKVTKSEPSVPAAAIGAPGGVDSVTIKVKGTKPTKFGKLPKNRTNYWQDVKGYVLAPSGAQTTTCIAAVNTVQQITTSTGHNYAFDQNFNSWYDLDPEFKNTGSIAGWLPGGTNPGDHKYLLAKNRFNVEVTNIAGNSAIIDFYLLCCKKATTDQPDAIWRQGLVDESMAQPSVTMPAPGQAVAINAANPGPSGIGSPTTEIVGQKPTGVALFRKYWKVAAVRSTKLSAGSTEIINFDINHPQLISQSVVHLEQQDTMRHRKGTYVLMMVQRGALVIDDTSGVGAKYPTYGSTEIAYIVNTFTSFGSRRDAVERSKVNVATTRATYGAGTNHQISLNQVILPVGLNTTQVI